MADTDQISREGVLTTSTAATKMGLIVREQPTSDYGIDAHFEIKEGEKATGRLIAVQIKAGQSYFTNENAEGFWHPVLDRHRNLWINHSLPVIVVLCDTENNTCYFEIVTNETCVRAGNTWKILVPKNKTLESSQLSSLVEIASPIAAASDFTICEEKDLSYAGARRISLDIIAHAATKSLNKPLLGAIVRASLKEGQNSTYFRDEISERALSNRPVDVVWGFVYLREIDRTEASWVCHFQWVSAKLDKSFRPSALDGEPDGNGLVIDWNNQSNSDLVKFLDNRRVTKSIFLSNVDKLLHELPAIETALTCVNSAERKESDMVNIQSLADAFEALWDGLSTPPQECQRLNQAINELRATVGNAGLIWSDDQVQSRGLKSTLFLSRGYPKKLTELNGDIGFLRKEVR